MPATRTTIILAGLATLVSVALPRPSPAHAQRPDPYQLVTIGLGAAMSRPLGAPPGDEVADGGVLAQYMFAIELLQADAYGYVRGSVDLSQVRTRTGLTLGVRPRLPAIGQNIRPYLGIGGGLLWLQPARVHDLTLEREIPARGEVALGVDWQPARALFVFAEYQLSAARYYPIRWVDDTGVCPATGRCPIPGPQRLAHLTHALWVGGRFQIF